MPIPHGKGFKIQIGNLVYKVNSTKQRSVSVIATTDKKVRKVSIPSYITYDKVIYKVTKIGDKVFKNKKKLKTVTIGRNIVSIGKKAFYNCKKINKITVKTKKLKKVGKQAFKKIKKNAIIKLPAKKKKKYAKFFRK